MGVNLFYKSGGGYAIGDCAAGDVLIMWRKRDSE